MSGTFLQHIKKLVSQGKLEDAISFYVEKYQNKPSLLLSFRYNSIINNFNSGVISFDIYKTELTKIADSVLSHISIPEELTFSSFLKKNVLPREMLVTLSLPTRRHIDYQ